MTTTVDAKRFLAEWGTRIMQAGVAVDSVHARLKAHRAAETQQWRHVPVFANLEFTIPASTGRRMQMQEQTWANGGEDVHFQGVMCSVFNGPDGANDAPEGSYAKCDAGFAGPTFPDAAGIAEPFVFYADFGWNFRVGRTGHHLLSPANGVSTLGSSTLRKDRAGRSHWFSMPLRIAAGDNVIVQMKPNRLPLIPVAGTVGSRPAIGDIRVAIALYGTRTGALHDR